MYVHFPSDVLAAAVLGVVIGELVFRYGNPPAGPAQIADGQLNPSHCKSIPPASEKQRLSALLFRLRAKFPVWYNTKANR